jgi:1,4-dihydroxy-2-naphthoate polyprenyltransferase
MDKTQIKAIFGPMRLPFLVLTPACVLLGVATAAWSGNELNPFHLALVLIGAVSTHISVNALNEYDDFKSGLDLKTEPTPFSGGSKALPDNPDKAHIGLITGLITFVIAVLTGIYFIYIRGVWLLPLGVFGLIIVAVYTRWITKSPFLCLIAPGLGFGPLMVMGTDFVLTGSYSWTAFFASMVPFFLVSDLLLLNQFPDVTADKSVGRKHLPITIGRKASVKVYGFFLACAYITVVLGYIAGTLPLESFLVFLSVILAIPTVKGVAAYANDIPKLIPYMGKSVIIIIATPVLLAVGLFIGGQ